jgi:hypothetical protein
MRASSTWKNEPWMKIWVSLVVLIETWEIKSLLLDAVGPVLIHGSPKGPNNKVG